jgi:hypothetical protein
MNLPVLIYTANIWRAVNMNENIIVTRIYLAQKFANEINANYGIITAIYIATVNQKK